VKQVGAMPEALGIKITTCKRIEIKNRSPRIKVLLLSKMDAIRIR
jgi:hypothetical protein